MSELKEGQLAVAEWAYKSYKLGYPGIFIYRILKLNPDDTGICKCVGNTDESIVISDDDDQEWQHANMSGTFRAIEMSLEERYNVHFDQ
jgi:hypothetical protein